MKKILILNVYGTKNLGDDAIWASTMNIINYSLSSKAAIVVECEDIDGLATDKWSNCHVLKTISPYGFALKGNKYLRFFAAIIDWIFFGGLDRLRNADVVFSIGGGYLLSRNSLRDWFGLTLTLLPLFAARITGKHVIYLPMSFGPFSGKLQEKACKWCMKGQTVFLREQESVKMYSTECTFSPDLALLLPKLHNTVKEDYVVVTAREWLKGDSQKRYEEVYCKSIDFLWEKYKLKTIFVPMAVNEIEDDDRRVARRIVEGLVNKDAFKVVQCSGYLEAQKIIGKARFGIHTRMHASILSLVEQTPFLLIGYGHKSKGLVDIANIEEYFCTMEEFDFEWVVKRTEKLGSKESLKDFESKTTRFLSKVLIDTQSLNICLRKILR